MALAAPLITVSSGVRVSPGSLRILLMIKEFDYMKNNRCWVTWKDIPDSVSCRFTWEFDAWVSKEGQDILEKWVSDGMQTENKEWEIIYAEWYAQDEGDAGRWDEALNEEDHDC